MPVLVVAGAALLVLLVLFTVLVLLVMSGVAAAVRALALYPIMAVAGMAMLHSVAGAPGRRRRPLLLALAVLVAAGQVLAVLVDETRPVIVVSALATLMLPALATRTRLAGAAGAVVALAMAGYAASSSEHGGLTGSAVQSAIHFGSALVHSFAAALWIGAVLLLVTAGPEHRRQAVRALTPPILASAIVLAVTGLTQAQLAGLYPSRNFGSWFGVLVVTKALVLFGGAAVVMAVWRVPHRLGGLVRTQPVSLAAVVMAGSALTAIPLPGASAPGAPVLADVSLGDARVPVLVAPNRPGWNLVHIGTDGASAGTDRSALSPGTTEPGTRHSWARVWLTSGQNRVWIRHRGDTAGLPLDTGSGRGGADLRGADGPECASLALGRAIAGRSTRLESCPADRLTAADADALRNIVGFIAGRGVKDIGLISDLSPRGVQAAATVRAEAARRRLDVAPPGRRRPLIVVSGWARADRAVRDVGAGRLTAQGTYLAPWLLNARLLESPAGQLLPLEFDPAHARGRAYVAAQEARFPGEPATAAGFYGWSGGPGPERTARQLYAASILSIPGTPIGSVEGPAEEKDDQVARSGAHGHGAQSGEGVPAPRSGGGHGAHVNNSWLPNGTITAVTGPLDGR
ncbi:hypothetical protein ACH35V_01790 [Actinomadura sp. 1N219]|uniref:hypothetical protein n=1 Tax=Actinomadura sp. 1N219 TaxID=3375152 RepID=UPI00379A87D1